MTRSEPPHKVSETASNRGFRAGHILAGCGVLAVKADLSPEESMITSENHDSGRDGPAAVPQIVDRETWQAARDELLVREKAHTREGDAIAAARRRLPMTEVDASITVVGPDGRRTLLDLFEDREELVV